MKPTLLLLLACLIGLTTGLRAQVNYEKLAGTKWQCQVDDQALGTVTFKDASQVDLSWQGVAPWKPAPGGVEIFGVALTYGDGSFIGLNAAGKTISLTHVAEPGEPAKAMAPAAAENPTPPTAPKESKPSEEVKFETLESVKLARPSDHAFSIQGQKVSFGKSTNRTWDTSWGSYSEDYERNATFRFTVSHFGGEGSGVFEVLFLGKTYEGKQYPYGFESRRLSVNGNESFDFDLFQQASESLYKMLNVKIEGGSKPDTWIAWMRKGETLMGLSAGRGSVVDLYESNPDELIALVKKVVKK